MHPSRVRVAIDVGGGGGGNICSSRTEPTDNNNKQQHHAGLLVRARSSVHRLFRYLVDTCCSKTQLLCRRVLVRSFKLTRGVFKTPKRCASYTWGINHEKANSPPQSESLQKRITKLEVSDAFSLTGKTCTVLRWASSGSKK